MERCFVIQPFDGGKFDERFNDTFKPAIEKAGLEAYRVNEDSSVKIPIETIEKGILESAMCFAEITTDNPNVWYELGYAFACEKDVVMVCGDDRKGHFPFDIQHKKVIKYAANSKSDFEKLEKEITETIKAYKSTLIVTQKLNSTPIQRMEGLESHEIAVLILLTEKSILNDNCVSYYWLQQEMGKSGYTNLAASVAIRTLAKSNMVVISKEYDGYNEASFDACRITEKGEDWVLSNQDKLQFRKNIDEDKIISNDDDLPF